MMASGKTVNLIIQTDDGVEYHLPLEALRIAKNTTDDSAGRTFKSTGTSTDDLPTDGPPPQGNRAHPSPPIAQREAQNFQQSRAPIQSAAPSASGPPPHLMPITAGNPTHDNGMHEEPRRGGPKDRGRILAFKRLDHLYDAKRHAFGMVETNTAEKPSNDRFEHFVFVVRRIFNIKNEYQRTLIDIKSLYLRDVLADSIVNVKGLTWTEEKPCLNPDFVLAHESDIDAHVAELATLDSPDEDKQKQIQHARLLLEYLNEDFLKDKERFQALVKDGLITFDLILMLLKANTVVVAESILGEPTLLYVRWSEFRKHAIKGDYVYMEASYIESDGKCFRYTETILELSTFRGSMPITSLAVYPFKYDPKYDQLRAELIERGKKFCALQRADDPKIPGAFRSYNGLGFRRMKDDTHKFHVKGRVMIDSQAFRRILPDYPGFAYTKASPRPRATRPDPDEENPSGPNSPQKTPRSRRVSFNTPVDFNRMTDDDFLLCPSTVDGFSFTDKLWGQFSVSKLEQIRWHENAFDSLVLPPSQKTLIRALIESHTKGAQVSDEEHPDFDDIIQGKGKGLVMLLHGKPGLGKTLTAESISETLKRPLYVLSAGDLPPDPTKLELHLASVLDIAGSWGAVLLIDEADIYLEQRGMGEVNRNALVCVFLRLLEYFRGILILTTNRVRTFDEAFQSRIHVAIAYNDLGPDAKVQIWKTFITKALDSEKSLPLAAVSTTVSKSKWAENTTDAMALTSDDYAQLARNDLNGRQIKNAVKAAHALATSLGERLNMKHIRQVLEVMESFDRAFRGAHTGNLYT